MVTKSLCRVAGCTWCVCCIVAIVVSLGLFVTSLVNQAGANPVPEAAFRLPTISLLTGGFALLVMPLGILWWRTGKGQSEVIAPWGRLQSPWGHLGIETVVDTKQGVAEGCTGADKGSGQVPVKTGRQ